jgi:hypothetical protein
VNAMLLNEFLKEHNAFINEQRKVNEQDCTQKQEGTISQLKNQVEALVAQANEQDSTIQR